MKVFVTFVVLLQLAFIAWYGIKLIPAASTANNEGIGNGNQIYRNDAVKRFREKYGLRIKSLMNSSVDPCDDFYEYACGNYSNIIEDMQVKFKRSNHNDIYFTLMDLFNKTLLNETRHPDEQYYGELQIAKQFLNSCVNAKLYPVEPQQAYLDVLNSIGGFPALNPSWNATTFDWFKMTAHLTRYGIVGLVNEKIYQKYPFPPYYERPTLGFGFDIYLENIATNESEGYVYSERVMRDLLNIYGVEQTKADSVIQGIMEFWRKVLSLDQTIVNFGNCNRLRYVNESFREDFSKWSSFFKTAWDVDKFKLAWVSRCPCDWYYNKLDEIAYERPQATANYLALKFLFSMNLKSVNLAKFQDLNCLISVKSAFPILASHFYIKDHYNKQIEGDIYGIFTELRASLKNSLKKADWLDVPTKQEALNKLETINIRVGQFKNDTIIDTIVKEMRKLNLSDSYAHNNLQVFRFKVDMQHYFYLHDDIDGSLTPPELLKAMEVRANYYTLDNSINIFAGILHPPAYHPHFPRSVKYGNLGYIMGHELTHAFSKFGSIIDSNLRRRNWWSKETSRRFEERSKCFVDHYNKYSVPELGINKKINGSQMIYENIADSGGLRFALAAFKKVLKDKDHDIEYDSRLESYLNLDSEQVYFLSFAQFHCSKYVPRDFWKEISGVHPFSKYRVLGSLQNSEEFSSVYNCPLGSPMNPEKKCRLW